MIDDPEIKASREPAKNGYGQNGSPQASSLTPGQKKPNIPNVSTPTLIVPGLDAQDTLAHRTSGAVKTHDGMSKPNGSPSGDVSGNARPSTKAAPSGAFKRT